MTQLAFFILVLATFQQCCHEYSVRSDNLNRIWIGFLVGLFILVISVCILYTEILNRLKPKSKVNCIIYIK